MESTKAVLLFYFASLACAYQVTFPLEYEVVNSLCIRNDLTKGTHRLEKDCKPDEQEVEYVGYVKSTGFVVCCLERPEGLSNSLNNKVGSKAKDFCATHGAALPSVLDFHIVEGEKSDVEEFPHMAALGYNNLGEIEFDCGGSLVSNKFVLTAAHCCNRKERLPTIVRLGRTSLDLNDSFDKSAVFDVKVKRVILHAEYSARSKYHDIALLELEREVRFSGNIRPICLQTDNDDDENGRNFTIIGFGISDLATRAKSDWLMKASIKQMPMNECKRTYDRLSVSGLSNSILQSQICARDDKQEKSADTCPGDSGSPLQVTSSDSHKYYIVGVTSFGLGCGSSFPSIYTRVSSYIPWIESVVWPSRL